MPRGAGPDPASAPSACRSSWRLRANSALYKRIIKHAGKARGQVALTKSEMWGGAEGERGILR